MTAGVCQRLLNGSHQCEGHLWGEGPRGAFEDELPAIALLAVRFEQPSEALRERWCVAAQRGDRAACLLEPVARRAPAATNPFEGTIHVAALREHPLGCLKLDRQATERMSEHVVYLACDAGALIERGGAPTAMRSVKGPSPCSLPKRRS